MPRQRAGFTMIELMIVVTIIGVMAAMIAPGMGEFIADARAAAAAEGLVRITRHMQARTQETGLAHLLVFSAESSGGGLGVVRIYEGMNNHCRQTPWKQAITGGEGHAPVDVLDMSSGEFNPVASGVTAKYDDTGRMVISLRVRGTLGGAESAVICLEPGGTVLEGIPSSVVGASYIFTKPPATGFNFIISRKMNSAVRGTDRIVFFSTSGIARFRY